MQGIFIPCGVGCRTQPIGIRMALGAHRCDIFALIMRQRAMQTALAVVSVVRISLREIAHMLAGRALKKFVQGIDGGDDRPGRDRHHCRKEQDFDDKLQTLFAREITPAQIPE